MQLSAMVSIEQTLTDMRVISYTLSESQRLGYLGHTANEMSLFPIRRASVVYAAGHVRTVCGFRAKPNDSVFMPV